eukprot:TRINITY_DN79188_c0_g1_i1.p1 TRINITY_DN79188_c0_g1~~TRINITY_DN79188_c0_g1_i1.p1  ORF type:complete len:639 (-),score=78.14 TRINITY_DN79188_c0_g1_i1:66-1715(-)
MADETDVYSRSLGSSLTLGGSIAVTLSLISTQVISIKLLLVDDIHPTDEEMKRPHPEFTWRDSPTKLVLWTVHFFPGLLSIPLAVGAGVILSEDQVRALGFGSMICAFSAMGFGVGISNITALTIHKLMEKPPLLLAFFTGIGVFVLIYPFNLIYAGTAGVISGTLVGSVVEELFLRQAMRFEMEKRELKGEKDEDFIDASVVKAQNFEGYGSELDSPTEYEPTRDEKLQAALEDAAAKAISPSGSKSAISPSSSKIAPSPSKAISSVAWELESLPEVPENGPADLDTLALADARSELQVPDLQLAAVQPESKTIQNLRSLSNVKDDVNKGVPSGFIADGFGFDEDYEEFDRQEQEAQEATSDNRYNTKSSIVTTASANQMSHRSTGMSRTAQHSHRSASRIAQESHRSASRVAQQSHRSYAATETSFVSNPMSMSSSGPPGSVYASVEGVRNPGLDNIREPRPNLWDSACHNQPPPLATLRSLHEISQREYGSNASDAGSSPEVQTGRRLGGRNFSVQGQGKSGKNHQSSRQTSGSGPKAAARKANRY